MKITDVSLKVQAVRRSQYPETDFPEFMLVGRSNVGKSSFINTLVGRKNIAYTSGKPGKTQTLNFYSVNHSFYLVDVPGYGYAAVNRKTQEKFGKMIEEYLEKRDELVRVFMLVDFRHKPTEDDKLMYNYIKSTNIPFIIVANKADKIAITKVDEAVEEIKRELKIIAGTVIMPFSSERKIYSEKTWEEIRNIIIE